ncbi:hypothetical protein PGB90_000921 [Kerria lacca]
MQYFSVLKRRSIIITQFIRSYSPKKKIKAENSEIPKNLLQDRQTAHLQKEKGVPYDCKPFKMVLDKNKIYFWCSCGQGHKQPMCDNTHRFHMLPITLKPIRFQVAETKEYWLCNCKQTKNRPFCDGSHRDPLIVDACLKI